MRRSGSSRGEQLVSILGVTDLATALNIGWEVMNMRMILLKSFVDILNSNPVEVFCS